MERRKKRPAARKKADASRAAAVRAVAALVTVCAAAYVALATGIGGFMAEKVFAPLFRSISGSADAAFVTPSPEAEAAALSLTPGGSDAPALSVSDLSLDERTYYAIQLGAYKNENNAVTCASQMRQRAAGGFVHGDGEHYRVIAAMYGSVEDARTVKTQLAEINGVEASIYTLTIPAAAMRLSAPSDKREAIEQGFWAIEHTCDGMLRLCNEYDLKKLTVEQVVSQLQDFSESLNAPAALLSGVSDPIASALHSLLVKFTDGLSECTAQKSENYVAFSSLLKYTNIEQICSYRDFITGLG